MLNDHFQIVEDEYFNLKGQVEAGRLTSAQFEQALKAMMVEHDGRYWIIGAKTGKWYAHDGQAWTEALPPEEVPVSNANAVSGWDLINRATPVVQTGNAFLMLIEDVFFLNDRGVVATGLVERGRVRVGDTVELVRLRGSRPVVVTGIEMFSRVLQEAKAGENVGCIFRDLQRKDVERGMVLAAPGSIQGPKEFDCEVSLLAKEEGGRPSPLFTGDLLDIFVQGRDVPCQISLPSGASTIAPGETRKALLKVIMPLPLQPGEPIVFRENGKAVGTGIVT